MKYIEEYREGEKCSGTYLCKTKQNLKTKNGKSYYSLVLQDKTGIADAKVWDLNNGIEDFDSMDYIHVDGLVTSFQGNLQWNVSRIRKSAEGDYDPKEYLPSTKKDVAAMYRELTGYVEGIRNPYLHQLAASYFVQDKDFIKKFKGHSAAKSIHHSFIGGLLEHTLGVVKICDLIAKNYPVIHRDLLLTAALFHDIGKIEELNVFPANDYTDDGQLLGHIFIGTEEVGRRIETIPDFPKKLATELQHCLLSHHGELEFGSPKKPAIVEAVALSHADNMDAKLQAMAELLDNSGQNEWLGYSKVFESNLRRTGDS